MSKGKRKGSVKRMSFGELGIDKRRHLELRAGCRNGRYDPEVLLLACQDIPDDVAAHVVKSAVEGKSFDRLEFDEHLGRIPYGRTNFYAILRLFYANLDNMLREKREDHEAI